MSSREQKKPLVIWLMFMMLVNWILLMVGWMKTLQHQNDWALVYIIAFVIVNVIGYGVYNSLVRKLR